MARIRTVKPELFSHEDLFDLEKKTGLPVRLAFIGLFTCCDREGRFKWRPRTLKKDVMPHDDVDFARVLDALATCGFVVRYTIGTDEYGVIPTWHKHQVINNRESQSEIPAPEETSSKSNTSTRDARVGDATTTPLVQDQGEGKGREGKGKEDQTHVASAPVGVADAGRSIALVSSLPERRKEPRASQEVQEVFAHWQRVMDHPQAKLDDKRSKTIAKRLSDGYTVGDLRQAVDGCRNSPHHMGENKQQAIYDDIELICRDGTHVDKFIKLAAPVGIADAGLRRQIETLQDWMERP